MKNHAQIHRRCASKKVKAGAEILGLKMRPATETVPFCHFQRVTPVKVSDSNRPMYGEERRGTAEVREISV